MKKVLVSIAIAAFVVCSFAQNKNNTLLNRILRGDFQPKSVKASSSMADGEYYTQVSKDSTAIVRFSYKTGKIVDSLFSVYTARECTIKKIHGYEFSSDESKILIYTDKEQLFRHSYQANYYVFERPRNLIYPLSKGGKQQMATFSPNGRLVAFVRNFNLYLVKLDYGTESQITTDGEENYITYGLPDWVYEEEFSSNKAFEFSPDNNFIAFLRFDQSQIPEYRYTEFKGLSPELKQNATYPAVKVLKYPKAGQPNSKVTVQTFNIATRVIKTMELNDNSIEYIPRIRFTPQPDKLAIFTLNRQQNNFTIYAANPRSGVCRLLIREESKTYIDDNVFDQISFLPDQIIFVSERDGNRHLYDYSPIGVLRRQITKGNWDVTDFLGYNAATGVYYYESNESGPLYNAIYALDGKGRKTTLSRTDGNSHGVLSSNYKYLTATFSNVKSVPLVEIKETQQGKTVVSLETNADLSKSASAAQLTTKEFFTFKTSKGIELNGWMIKPSGFDVQKRYPVVMVQYSGPNSQQVKDEWKVDWTQSLASQGYLVVCVDGRGTGGRGEAFSHQTYRKLGIMEAEDQIEAARYLGGLSYIDKANIAIWGWSYGGYNVLMSMSLGKGIFKAGIAVAPVTDWRFYDSVYAERYMQTPNENSDGYDLSSPMKYVDQFEGNLLIVHGTGDDNVHVQNTYEYTERLVQAGKQFDMQIYTNRDHYISGGKTRQHLYARFMRFLDQNLK